MIKCNEKEALNEPVHEILVLFPLLINEGLGKHAQTGQSCLHTQRMDKDDERPKFRPLVLLNKST